MQVTKKNDISSKARRLAVYMAGVGIFWILVVEIGNEYGWSQRTRLLFDLIVLTNFGFGLWQGFNLWRERRGDED